MTTANETVCKCGGKLEVIDNCETSVTAGCPNCGHCTLVVGSSRCRRSIWLADFHLKRGNDPDQRPLADLTMATRLVVCLVMDMWPSHGTIVDYGIDSGAHLGALRDAVGNGITAYDLDRVMGDGPAITKLVLNVPGQRYRTVEFTTAYDSFADRIAHKA